MAMVNANVPLSECGAYLCTQAYDNNWSFDAPDGRRILVTPLKTDS
jgi:hypothetical protein